MTGFTLKIIALVSMLLDHTMKSGLFSQKTLLDLGLDIQTSYQLINLIEPFGRLAFPIFAFMVAEGMRHTRSRKKYILRMLLFGVLSEIPFDLVHFTLTDGMIPWYAYITPLSSLNIFFTLALGALGVTLTDWLLAQEKLSSAAALPAILCAAAAEIFTVDYLLFGVATVYAAYFPKKRKHQLLTMIGVMAILYLGYASYWFTNFILDYHGMHFLMASAAVGLLALYNGERGRSMKWLFYAAYPLHLTALVLIKLIPGVI